MEDYSPTSDKAEEAPVEQEQWLPGNFVKYWLERLRSDDEDSEDKPKKKKKSKREAESDKETTEESKSERWLSKLRNSFGNWLGFELIPAAQAAEMDNSQASQQPEASSAANSEAVTEEVEDQSETANSEEQGILAVSADAQRRYYGHELEEPSAEDEPEIEVDEVETEQPENKHETLLEEEDFLNQTSVEQQPSIAESDSDASQRQQAERLEKKVKKLKKKTRSLKWEQEDIIKKQKKFAKELEKRQKAQDRFEKVTIPKMEQDRQELRKRLENVSNKAPRTKQELPERKAIIPETGQQKPIVKTEYVPTVERVEARTPAEKPAEVKQQPADAEKLNKLLEIPAEETVLRESIFERRHEVKDESGKDQSISDTSISRVSTQQIPAVPPPFTPPQPTGNIPPIPTEPTAPPIPSKPEDRLYKQAALTGAVSGLGLTIIAILIILLMR